MGRRPPVRAGLRLLSPIHPPAVTDLHIHVQPRASRNAVVGWHGNALKVALTAPPVDGAANAALVAFIADYLGLKKSQVTLVRGESSRQKTLRVDMTAQAVDKKLPARN